MLMLMEEIKNLRENNKTLTDEERRKNAEAMILKISKYMSLDDDEYAEEDENDFEGY